MATRIVVSVDDSIGSRATSASILGVSPLVADDVASCIRRICLILGAQSAVAEVASRLSFAMLLRGRHASALSLESVAASAVFLAAKLLEAPIEMAALVQAQAQASTSSASPSAASMTMPPLPGHCASYQKRSLAILRGERDALVACGFDLPRTSESPQAILTDAARMLEVPHRVLALAWALLGEAPRLGASARFSSAALVCAALQLSADGTSTPTPVKTFWPGAFGVTSTELCGASELLSRASLTRDASGIEKDTDEPGSARSGTGWVAGSAGCGWWHPERGATEWNGLCRSLGLSDSELESLLAERSAAAGALASDDESEQERYTMEIRAATRKSGPS